MENLDPIAIILSNKSRDLWSTEPDATVYEAIQLMADKGIGALLVMKGDSLVGIFSERDVIYRLADEGDACLERPIGEVMTAPAITVERSATVLDALALMTKRRIRHLPVVDGETMCGFISIGDLVKARLDEIQRGVEAPLGDAYRCRRDRQAGPGEEPQRLTVSATGVAQERVRPQVDVIEVQRMRVGRAPSDLVVGGTDLDSGCIQRDQEG